MSAPTNIPDLLRKASVTLAINRHMLETLVAVDTRLAMLARKHGGDVRDAAVALRGLIAKAMDEDPDTLSAKQADRPHATETDWAKAKEVAEWICCAPAPEKITKRLVGLIQYGRTTSRMVTVAQNTRIEPAAPVEGRGDAGSNPAGHLSDVVDDLIDAMNGLIYDHCHGEARLAAEKVLASHRYRTNNSLEEFLTAILADHLGQLQSQRDDMLTALKAAAPFMRNGDGGTRGGVIEMNRLAGILEAAIAKAEQERERGAQPENNPSTSSGDRKVVWLIERKFAAAFRACREGVARENHSGVAMNAEQFRDIFHVLHNIDKADLESAGVIKPGANGGSDWTRFNNDVGTFVLKLRQENLEALFELVRSRL